MVEETRAESNVEAAHWSCDISNYGHHVTNNLHTVVVAAQVKSNDRIVIWSNQSRNLQVITHMVKKHVYSSTVHQLMNRSEVSQLLNINACLRWLDRLRVDLTMDCIKIVAPKKSIYELERLIRPTQKILEVDPHICNGCPVGGCKMELMCWWSINNASTTETNLAKQNYGKTDLTCQHSQFNLFNFVQHIHYTWRRCSSRTFTVFPRSGTERSHWSFFLAPGFEGFVQSQAAADLIRRRLFAFKFHDLYPHQT